MPVEEKETQKDGKNTQPELVMKSWRCVIFNKWIVSSPPYMDRIFNPSGLQEACKSSWLEGETIELHKINTCESNTYMWFTLETLKI